MKVSHIVKINFLLLGLGLTLYFIHSLNARGLSPGLQTLFGFTSTETEEGTQLFKLNWCDDKVAGLIKPNHFKLSKQNGTWIKENGSVERVSEASLSAWLSQYCAVKAIKVDVDEKTVQASFVPALIVKFVNGEIDIVRRNQGGAYVWRGQAFESKELDTALEQLSQIPEERRN